jgi:molybdopterin converting factor small subunit
MSVNVKLFYPALQSLLSDPDDFRLDGTTVGECLADLLGRHPQAERLLFDSKGDLQKQVYVFVNQEGMFKAPLDRPVKDTDTLLIAVLAIGG